MNYQEERMKDLIGSLPQNRNVEWDSVAPVIDFEFSRNAGPRPRTQEEYQASRENAEAREALHRVLRLQAQQTVPVRRDRC